MFMKNKDMFTKAEMAKELIALKIGNISGDEILTIMCHLNHYWHDRRKEPLTEKEMIVYEALCKENLNPMTVYSWLLATKAPIDVRQRYRRGKIDSRQIVRFGRNEVEKERCKQSLEMMNEVRNLVEVILK